TPLSEWLHLTCTARTLPEPRNDAVKGQDSSIPRRAMDEPPVVASLGSEHSVPLVSFHQQHGARAGQRDLVAGGPETLAGAGGEPVRAEDDEIGAPDGGSTETLP